MAMKIYNKSKRTFTVYDKNTKGDRVQISVLPQKFTSLSDDKAKQMLKSYPRDIVSSKTVDASAGEVDKLTAENAKLEKQISEIKKANEDLTKGSTSKQAELEKQIEELKKANENLAKKVPGAK